MRVGALLDYLAAAVAVGAGIYLLGTNSLAGVAAGQSWFDVLAHGIGAYFVAKGVWMARMARTQERQLEAARKLVELAAQEHVVRTTPRD